MRSGNLCAPNKSKNALHWLAGLQRERRQEIERNVLNAAPGQGHITCDQGSNNPAHTSVQAKPLPSFNNIDLKSLLHNSEAGKGPKILQ